MKKEARILIAGSLSFFAVLGIIGIKNFLSRKKYDDNYSDFHRHFENRFSGEEHHGIEFYAMR